MDENRLIDLETKFAHQDFMIEEMRAALLEQHKYLFQLEKNMKLLKDRLDSVNPDKSGAAPVNEKPPHY